MAAGDLYIECEGGGKQLIASSGLLEIFNALLVKTNTDKYGLRAVTTSAAEANISAVVECGAPLKGWDELFQFVIVETTSGKPAIGFITES